ncbi:hypothetical protein PTKIN_Ptkin03bG0110600 [Pterospermum kingtungense]
MTLVDSLRPSEYVFMIFFSACSRSGKALELEGRQFHGYVFKSGFKWTLGTRMMGESVEWDRGTYVIVFGLRACLKD